MHDFIISKVDDRYELEQILFLQNRNFKKNISREEALSEGFVTVEHSFELIYQMHLAKPSVVVKLNDAVIGYALVMTQEFCHSIEVLKPMFQQFDKIIYHNKSISSYPYFVMGQICIDKNFRRLGLFNLLYEELFKVYAGEYELILTEVSKNNQRSVRAHQKLGMLEIAEYTHADEIWKIFLFDLNKK